MSNSEDLRSVGMSTEVVQLDSGSDDDELVSHEVVSVHLTPCELSKIVLLVFIIRSLLLSRVIS